MQAVKAQAQRPSEGPDALFRFEHFRTSEGLAVDAWVEHILQDQRGFLWVGTAFGLHRYDGYTFATVLRGFAIDALVEDREGMIWVGKEAQGLSRFDPETGAFTHYRHDPDDPTSLSHNDIRALHVDRQGILWVGTLRGLDRFETDTGTFTHFKHDPDNPSSMSDGGVIVIYEDQADNLWISTAIIHWGRVREWSHTVSRVERGVIDDGRLSRLDRETETFTHYEHAPGDPYSLLDNRVSHINEDRQGNLYVGTCQRGLHRYDRVHDRFERLVADTDDLPQSIGDPDRLYAPLGYEFQNSCNPVTIIHEDARGGFWVGTFGGGLNYFDGDTMTPYRNDPSDPHSLSIDAVLSMVEDRQGTLWVGTHLGGLNKVVPNPARGFRPLVVDAARPESQLVVTAVLEDEEGRLWMGTQEGDLYRFDPSTGARLPTPLRFPRGHIEGLYEDREGMIWVGSAGLYRLDRRTGARQHFTRDPNDPASLSNDAVNSILEDTTGQLWVGNWGGLNRLDGATGAFTRYQHDAEDPGSLAGNSVFPLYVDRQGTFWVGVYQDKGLSRYDPAQDRFTNFLDSTAVNALYEDSKGRFWVGSWGDGLLLFDRTTGTHTAYTTADGLAHDIVGSILEDDQGYLWIVTPGGLSWFDPERLNFINFTEADGFPNTMTDAEQDEALKTRNGDFIIGGERGVTIVSPGEFTTNPHAPVVVVTGLQVFDAPLQEGGLLPSAVRLDHDKNDLTFEYVGLHFAQPEKNRYAYQLEGYDPEWRQAGIERMARYTSLDPGDYVFRVKASNGDGVWNETGASVRVTILPPWWRTTWAYGLYGVLFVAGVFVVDRFQRRRLIAKEREKARERELEQAREIEKAHTELQQSHEHLKATQDQLIQSEKMASLGQLTAGIAHEIKNPLNFVNNFAQLCTELADELEEELAASHDKPVAEIEDDLKDIVTHLKINAAKIEEHGKRADGIVQSMLMHSRSTAGERRATDVNALLDEYVNLAYHGMRANIPDFNVTLACEYDDAVGEVEMVQQEIGQVLINLLNNAFYAVHERKLAVDGHYAPTVAVRTQKRADAVEIQVQDNGSGIPEDVKAKIFEPFYTTKPTGSGTGLGLSLSYDIVTKGHGGQLAVASEPGDGATFIITLPVSTL